ncbi:MAG TPA: triose-phosphate isomerase [Myxococcota bacterium]|nr:triose-phosphate isomerase [Myxococcota bacterium]
MTPRRKLIAGNWKLNKTVAESVALAVELSRLLGQVRDCDLVVAPVYTAIAAVAQKLAGTPLAVAGQDLYPEDEGAFTGAVSGPLLKEAGASYVLVGHSERRQLFGETLESSQKRMAAALRAGLTPILCVGETLKERQADTTAKVVGEQLDAGIKSLSAADLARIVIAYEPVWAIGTGQVATPAQAQEVHNLIRERLRHRDAAVAEGLRILYGGSVKPDNAKELLGQRDIDGALVGGASLNAASFAGIVAARKP